MTLNSKFKVDMPKSGIITRKSGDYKYVYKVTRTYRNEKGQPTNERVSIGRLDAESGKLIPNERYYEFYGNEGVEFMPTYSSVRSIGATFAISHIFTELGLAEILKDALGNKRSQSALTACFYMACRGNVMEYISDYCEGYTLHETELSPQGASALFASITREERMAFFKAWVSKQQYSQYLAYDVTSFSSYAKGIADTEWGYNRDGDRLPQINLGCYLGQKSGLPVFYVTYPGSILDKSHLPYMMAHNAELGITDVGFVMDRGFCSTANVSYLDSEGIPFIMGVEIRHKMVKATIDEVRDNMTSMRYRLKQGIFARSVSGRFYGTPSTLHVFYDPGLAELQRRDLFRVVESIEEKLTQWGEITVKDAKRYSGYFNIHRQQNGSFSYERNYDRIDRADSNNGFFCILSNTQLGSEEILDYYLRKDVIEKGFDDIKNHIDMKRMRTHTSETTEGKLFLAFVSLIAVSQLGIKLSGVMKEKGLSKESVISELEKIKVVTLDNDKRLLNPLTKTQKLLLAPLGLDEVSLKQYVSAS